ncbi:hypothetical protein SBRY_50459 [Actinacidiphila bryophytorum]|uniref:Uncharacterized protein n=1 Tax=Actinacidiphila bryophytorum TaxID=1436133 RepID=A0A9W4H4D6_9ACTN|nr:hypothetical protein SBRY_50459 [Actinacidiphila bryophytorum]
MAGDRPVPGHRPRRSRSALHPRPGRLAHSLRGALPPRQDRPQTRPQLPPAAYDPAWACENLDRWSSIHHLGTNDPHAVSATLPMTLPEEPSP